MSGQDPDLEQFLGLVRKLLAEHVVPGELVGDAARVSALGRALSETQILNLALETSDLDQSLRWLAETVAQVANSSPSIAFVLAARYTAQRATRSISTQRRGTVDVTSGAFTQCLRSPAERPDDTAAFWTVPNQFSPTLCLLIDIPAHSAVFAEVESFTDFSPSPMRSGLRDAELRLVRLTRPPVELLDSAGATRAAADWNILTSAVALGISESALQAAESYAADREQFGSRLTSFAGIRALLADMHVRVAGVRALLSDAIEAGPESTRSLTVSAVAGRTAVDVGIDAIQVHGGYGYIDEYPVASLLRDAISVRARGSAGRSALVGIASDRLGPIE